MDPLDIQAFVSRDRSAVARLKRVHWAEQFHQRGAAATVAAGRALWAHARRTRPDWPDARQRAADLADHVALKQLLDRAAYAFTSR